jgi:2,3-bisphosphoglycerate-independent phosphoglycerate mutase
LNRKARILFLFLDGVGLGVDNPDVNPFSRFELHHIDKILNGHKLLADGHAQNRISDNLLADTDSASLLALDACLGVEGIPQSATGQASLMTGINAASFLGYHEGPKPTPPIFNLVKNGTMLSELANHGKSAALVNAFPKRYFETIDAGYRLPGVIALSTRLAGYQLKTAADLNEGNAISADFTAEGWRSHLGFPDTPVLTTSQAGERLSTLAQNTDLAIFEYWLTDVAGHHRDFPAAQKLLESLDMVMNSLINSWNFDQGLILLTSDHGNLEDLSTRRHTLNNVPLLIIGSREQRALFIQYLKEFRATSLNMDLTHIAPAILKYIG